MKKSVSQRERAITIYFSSKEEKRLFGQVAGELGMTETMLGLLSLSAGLPIVRRQFAKLDLAPTITREQIGALAEIARRAEKERSVKKSPMVKKARTGV